MSDPITVSTGTRKEYPIYIGSNLGQSLYHFIQRFHPSKAFAVIDENVLDLHEAKIMDELGSYFEELLIYSVPAGEASKNFDQYQKLTDFILNNHAERSIPLFAIGGGVTGDLAGFAASTALRGIPLIHIPTTLLAMVDSSIGGKTGINHAAGKNLIGSFYQPEAVFSDLSYLETLENREWVNGMSEIIKYGFIADPVILDDIFTLSESASGRDPNAWKDLIKRSAMIKNKFVSEDVNEKGIRAYLNFGHTFAHVIEQCGSYGDYSHGEAVFAGMYGAVFVSNKLGSEIDLSNLNRLRPFYELSLKSLDRSSEDLTRMMRTDKKVKDGIIRLILLEQIGSPYIKEMDNEDLITASWEFIRSRF
ncbi:3-dehydroquinate synthase [Balneola sp. MJW-20]|uniref:3-dehydroquinate synthase n=1 Tax=Gracilimonas aurantiaca TaxID=3234185 RepID=UPI00346502E1